MATFIFYSILLILLTPPLGAYMHHVYSREKYGRLENAAYKLIRVNPEIEQPWRRYASGVL